MRSVPLYTCGPYFRPLAALQTTCNGFNRQLCPTMTAVTVTVPTTLPVCTTTPYVPTVVPVRVLAWETLAVHWSLVATSLAPFRGVSLAQKVCQMCSPVCHLTVPGSSESPVKYRIPLFKSLEKYKKTQNFTKFQFQVKHKFPIFSAVAGATIIS
jgi:hypothetical protein